MVDITYFPMIKRAILLFRNCLFSTSTVKDFASLTPLLYVHFNSKFPSSERSYLTSYFVAERGCEILR